MKTFTNILLMLLCIVTITLTSFDVLAKKPIRTDIEVDPPTVVEQVVKTGSTLTIYYDHPDLFNTIVIAIVHTSDYTDALTPLYIGVDDNGDGIIQIYGLERAGKYYITLMTLDKSLDLYLY